MQSRLCKLMFWKHLGGVWEHLGGKPGRHTSAGLPPDGQILSGGVAWQAGGQQAKQRSKNTI